MRSAVVGRRWWSSTSTRVPMASAASLNARCLSSRSRRHHVRWSLSTSSRSAVTVHLTLLLYLLTSACSLPVPIQSDAVVIRLLSQNLHCRYCEKGSPYSITERRVPELIPVLWCSQPAGDVSHKPGGRLLLLSARPAVTPATLKSSATNFAAWWTEARWVWTVCLRLLPDSVASAIWTRALLRPSPAR